MTMRAIVQTGYGDVQVLRLDEARARPVPGAGEVLLRVRAAGIDRGTWHVMHGLPRLLRLAFGVRRPRARFSIPGLDVAGVVEAVGPGVTKFAPGDEVFGVAMGSLAQYALAKEAKLARRPSSCSLEQAAALGISGMTALQALDAAALEAGQRLLVTGASGGVGHYVVQLAAANGIDVTAVCSGAKADAVARWGAARVLDYAHEHPFASDERYDAVIDIAGGASLRVARRVTTERGTIVFVGQEGGNDWTGGFGRPMRNSLRMVGARQRYVMLVSSELGADLERLAELVERGACSPSIHATYPLARTPEAMQALARGEVVGKLAIDVTA